MEFILILLFLTFGTIALCKVLYSFFMPYEKFRKICVAEKKKTLC